MNIWIINHNAIPPNLGSQNRHYYFSKYLSQKGHSVKIITASTIHNSSINMINTNDLYAEKIIEGVPYTFVKVNNYHGNGIDRIYNLLEFSVKIWNVCKHFNKPDVIYTSSPDIFAAFSSLLWAQKTRIRCIVEIRDLWPESIVAYARYSPSNLIIKILYLIERWIYRNADQLVFTMEGGKQYILDKQWESIVSLNKIYNINNGIDIEEFDNNLKSYILQDSDLDDKQTYKIVYTGSIRKANNIQQIIDCAALLDKKYNIVFLIYGVGVEQKKLIQYCKKKKISNVYFKGKVEKKYIPYILSKADLNLVNYMQTDMFRYGGSQNKLFEYLASGKPVISNVRQGYCLINRFQCGISKALSTPEEYASAILQIYNLPKEQYKKICANARKTAIMYDYQTLTNSLENILIQGD